MSKIDELVKVYDEAWSEAYDTLAYDVSEEEEQAKRAGIIAVVTALRDELSMSKDENSCSACDANYDLFHEILGDAEKKVAGGSARRADEQRAAAPTTDLLRMGQLWDAAPETFDRPIKLKAQPEETVTVTNMQPVIVRTYSAGVHFGYLKRREGKEVDLVKSRRIWRWFGANTLSEIAATGLDVEKSRVAVPVTITLTEVIEVIDCTPEAVEKIEAAKWAK